MSSPDGGPGDPVIGHPLANAGLAQDQCRRTGDDHRARPDRVAARRRARRIASARTACRACCPAPAASYCRTGSAILASVLPATTSSRAPRSATRGARSRASATAPIWLCRRSPASATPRGSCPARAREAPASSPASTAASTPCWSIFRSRRCGGSRSAIASKSMPMAPASSCSIIPRSRSRIARPACWRAGACAATADGLPFRSPTWCPRP